MKSYYPGLLLAGIITFSASLLSKSAFAAHFHFSALTLSIVLGMAVGNSFYGKFEPHFSAGVNFAKSYLLRLGIVLYGFNITLQDIGTVGINAIATDAVMLIATFVITYLSGTLVFRLDKQLVCLTAAGCSICGAAAIMAATPVIRGESHKVAVAVALIVIFGTISMFLYPQIYPYLSHYLSPHQFGIYTGSTVHEVAQVYAVGENINAEVANTAVITKMIRVMMLAPFLLVLSWAFRENRDSKQHNIMIPWFALCFIGVAVFNSFGLLPKSMVQFLIGADNILLMLAMSALGLTTQISAFRQAGIKPLLLGALISLWLVIGGFTVNRLMQAVFA